MLSKSACVSWRTTRWKLTQITGTENSHREQQFWYVQTTMKLQVIRARRDLRTMASALCLLGHMKKELST